LRPAHALIGEELIDRYLLMIHPVVLWTGKPLFEPGVSRADLRLSENVSTPGGLAILTFGRADGEATAG
jgi:dihydrofolate reductase